MTAGTQQDHTDGPAARESPAQNREDGSRGERKPSHPGGRPGRTPRPEGRARTPTTQPTQGERK